MDLISAGVLEHAHRAPRLPWAELVECLTCVNLEEYVADPSLSQYAAAGSQRRVTPEHNALIVSEAHLCLFGNASSEKQLALSEYKSPPLLLNESEEKALIRRWQVARCANCDAVSPRVFLNLLLLRYTNRYKYAVGWRCQNEGEW